MGKEIKNIGERTFAKIMEAKGFTLIAQPYLKHLRLRPDFYCVEEAVYYEVIATRQAYYNKKDKILKAQKTGVKIRVVCPDGETFPRERIKKPKKIYIPLIVKLPEAICKRCNNKWTPRVADVKMCPACKSRLWDKERGK